MKTILIITFVLTTLALILAGCAFDKLRLSVDNGSLSPVPTNAVNIWP